MRKVPLPPAPPATPTARKPVGKEPRRQGAESLLRRCLTLADCQAAELPVALQPPPATSLTHSPLTPPQPLPGPALLPATSARRSYWRARDKITRESPTAQLLPRDASSPIPVRLLNLASLWKHHGLFTRPAAAEGHPLEAPLAVPKSKAAHLR